MMSIIETTDGRIIVAVGPNLPREVILTAHNQGEGVTFLNLTPAQALNLRDALDKAIDAAAEGA